MPFGVDDLLAAGATLGAAGITAYGQYRANQETRASVDKQMKFQEQMSNTAYQRAMKDMSAAGVNPIMVSKLGGASTPQGASYDAQNELSTVLSSAKQAMFMKAELKNLQAQTGKTLVDSRKGIEDTAYVRDLRKVANTQVMLNQASAMQSMMNARKIQSETFPQWFNATRAGVKDIVSGLLGGSTKGIVGAIGNVAGSMNTGQGRAYNAAHADAAGYDKYTGEILRQHDRYKKKD